MEKKHGEDNVIKPKDEILSPLNEDILSIIEKIEEEIDEIADATWDKGCKYDLGTYG